MSQPPDVEYPIEPFEWSLPAVQVWCFQFLHDWRYIDFQIGHFVVFAQSKTDSHFSDFGQDHRLLKTTQAFSDKKFKNYT